MVLIATIVTIKLTIFNLNSKIKHYFGKKINTRTSIRLRGKVMDRKIIVGSIITVAILVGVSFTSVVGYSSVKTISVKESPLFNIRTKGAIGEENKELTCNYVGKENTLLIPKRDDRIVLTKKVIDTIGKMDDETFEKLLSYIIIYAQKDERFNDVSPDEIREIINSFRNSDTSLPMFDADANHNIQLFTTHTCLATCMCPITSGHGIKGYIFCFIFIPLLIIFDFLYFLIDLIHLFTILC